VAGRIRSIEIARWLGHYRFPPYPFCFIIHSSYHSVPYKLAAESVIPRRCMWVRPVLELFLLSGIYCDIRRGIHKFRDWWCHLYSSCNSMMQHYLIVIVNLGSQYIKFHAAGWTCWFFASYYFESCIWPDAISWCIRQRNSIRFYANLGKVHWRP
jgi:hypothetical protein